MRQANDSSVAFSAAVLWRAERADARNNLACAESRAKFFGFESECRWIAGGYAIFAGHWTHLTQGIGIGVSGPVHGKNVSSLIQYFHSRLAIPTVQVSSRLPAVISMFKSCGFREAGEWSVLTRKINRHHRLLTVHNVEVVRGRNRSAWIRAASDGFADDRNVADQDCEVGATVAHAHGVTLLQVRAGNDIAGTAAIACRSGVAVFFADSTRLKFRGCGVQSSLIGARVKHAAECGSHLAIALTSEAHISETNYLRMGFSPLYKRICLQYRS